jgi:hypothetical protein
MTVTSKLATLKILTAMKVTAGFLLLPKENNLGFKIGSDRAQQAPKRLRHNYLLSLAF